MDGLRRCIRNQITISDNVLDKIVSCFQSRDLNKGEILLSPETVCREMYFIESGYIRMFNSVEGKEVTLWVGGPGKFVTSLTSFVFESMNYWTMQSLDQGRVLSISRKDHMQLCEENNKWLEFDNRLLAYSFATLEKRLFSQLYTTAKERLETLFQEEPEILQNVPQQYIASLLGIAPESLSRLRKNLAVGSS